MIYFAYGSNLDPRQMRARCPGSVRIGTAVLPNSRLVFAGHSLGWGGAVATLVPAAGVQTPGVLYELEDADLQRLDRFEGCPVNYRRMRRRVQSRAGRLHIALVYVREADPQSHPSETYLNVIVSAYHRYGFDLAPLAPWMGERA